MSKVYVFVRGLELKGKKPSRGRNRIPFDLVEGAVYKASKMDDGVTYEIHLDDARSMIVNKEDLENPDYDQFPIVFLDFVEIDFESISDYGISEDEIKKLIKWELESDDDYDDEGMGPHGDIDTGGFTAMDFPRGAHPAFDLPMHIVKLSMYELRERNPDLFLSIFSTIDIYLKSHK